MGFPRVVAEKTEREKEYGEDFCSNTELYIEEVVLGFSRDTEPVQRVSPAFPQFGLHHFTFMKDLHYYLFSLTERSQKIFAFTKIRQKRQ